MERCLALCEFGDVVLFSHALTRMPTVIIDKFESVHDWSRFALRDMPRHPFKTDFVLLVQWDSWILNPDAWTDGFFAYDYIGSHNKGWKGGGNGGFSLRSSRLFSALRSGIVPEDRIELEDELICHWFHQQFVDAGVKFADRAASLRFAGQDGSSRMDRQAFGFHGILPTSFLIC